MNKKAFLFASLIIFLLGVQCRHRAEYAGDRTAFSEKPGESLEVTAKWMKYKELKVDMGIQITNGYKHAVVLKHHEFHVEMNGDKGYLTSPRSATFEMEPGETISRQMTFRFDKEKDRDGPVKLFIKKLQAGPLEKPGKDLPNVTLDLPL